MATEINKNIKWNKIVETTNKLVKKPTLVATKTALTNAVTSFITAVRTKHL